MNANFFKQLEMKPSGHREDLATLISTMPWNTDGLLPVIAQSAADKSVLMLAWTNQEALHLSLSTGYSHYWSRSRGQLWKKGESSGHVQQIKQVKLDCDGDTLLYIVDQKGPACHTNRQDCFFWTLNAAGGTIDPP